VELRRGLAAAARVPLGVELVFLIAGVVLIMGSAFACVPAAAPIGVASAAPHIAARVADISAPVAAAASQGIMASGAGGAATAMQSLIGVLNVATSVVAAALPLLVAGYAWQQRRTFMAVTSLGVALLLLPGTVRTIHRSGLSTLCCKRGAALAPASAPKPSRHRSSATAQSHGGAGGKSRRRHRDASMTSAVLGAAQAAECEADDEASSLPHRDAAAS